ncbi:MAG: response regulator transcription factor [Chitinophagales bacterium]
MKYAATNIRILYVEDDTNLAYVTKDNLERAGLKITHCANGDSAYSEFIASQFHLCIIDIMLPRLDGLTLISQIRKHNQNVPILILSAKSMLEDRLEGFKTGADDYLMKPYSIDELLYKVDVFLKRSNVLFKPHEDSDKPIISIGNYLFDFNQLTLKLDNIEHKLTLREAELLRILCLNKNKVVKRGEIIEKVWQSEENNIGRSIDVFISKLRKHLANDSKVHIETIRSFGYKLIVS